MSLRSTLVRLYENIVGNRDDLILNALFEFKPVKRLEFWVNVKMFGNASNDTGMSILNMLAAFHLNDG